MRKSKNLLIKHIKVGDKVVFKKDVSATYADMQDRRPFKTGVVAKVVCIDLAPSFIEGTYVVGLKTPSMKGPYKYLDWKTLKKSILIK